MFRWCAYCWSFLGEREPRSDLGATHGICAVCAEANAVSDHDIVARTRPIKAVHLRLANIATEGKTEDVNDVLEDGARLGLGPLELLVGVMQPALYEAGRLWDEGKITPADEARLSAFCDEALRVLMTQQRARITCTEGRPIFLVRAGGNRHDLGLKMLAFALREAKREVFVFQTTPPKQHLCELAGILQPSSIGISVALPEQLGYVDELLQSLTLNHLAPRVVVGGGAVSDHVPLPPSVVRWTSAFSLLTAPKLFA